MAAQIKLLGRAAVVEDEDARRAMWERLKPHTRKQFEANLPSGVTFYDDGRPVWWEDGSGATVPYGNRCPDRALSSVRQSVIGFPWMSIGNKKHNAHHLSASCMPEHRQAAISARWGSPG